MNESFLKRYPITGRLPDAVPPTHRLGSDPDGWSLMAQLCGTTFGHGVYRVHTAASSDQVAVQVQHAYALVDAPSPFGFDWLGRQFALNDQQAVVMFEPGTGEILDIGVTLRDFHAREIADRTNAALASDFFRAWRQSHPDPLAFTACVGYRVPLFLGGADSIANLEVTDTDVYWELVSQLVRGVRHRTVGSPIRVQRQP